MRKEGIILTRENAELSRELAARLYGVLLLRSYNRTGTPNQGAVTPKPVLSISCSQCMHLMQRDSRMVSR
jgi:hypothetical protein